MCKYLIFNIFLALSGAPQKRMFLLDLGLIGDLTMHYFNWKLMGIFGTVIILAIVFEIVSQWSKPYAFNQNLGNSMQIIDAYEPLDLGDERLSDARHP